MMKEFNKWWKSKWKYFSISNPKDNYRDGWKAALEWALSNEFEMILGKPYYYVTSKSIREELND